MSYWQGMVREEALIRLSVGIRQFRCFNDRTYSSQKPQTSSKMRDRFILIAYPLVRNNWGIRMYLGGLRGLVLSQCHGCILNIIVIRSGWGGIFENGYRCRFCCMFSGIFRTCIRFNRCTLYVCRWRRDSNQVAMILDKMRARRRGCLQ